ncbi:MULTISPECIES: NAD(P)/FAD-dependent oxidoreductase [unclassified Streptomyces]|uniref:phytoene desaturase family protein n=1 Tax=unclassified Streptomyces TaxID=2593676 RepID=UPI000DBA5CA3|nr:MULTISPECIES: NAD(P)/FAD-dependent oxidoreductase [unclassified Streptomyces]MYT70570.1 NAD(P)-binding protein [Streptomyces sp. SID8367]RAJ90272.1 phytoene desaturase [Streptomyces sp. PsTaAH-137]
MARIAVIGAGLGAMAAAARLAVAGHRPVVFERASTYGGAVGRFERDGFAFDTGPGLLPLPAVYRDLFIKTGKEPLEDLVGLTQVEPAVRHVFADGTAADLPNARRAGVAEALDATVGAGAGARWSAFMDRAREAWDRSRRPLLEEPLWPNWEVLAEREPYPAVPHKRLLRKARTAATLADIGDLELAGDPRLVALLESYALAYGLDPRTAPASAAVLPYMEQTFGTWAVTGGMRALADAVHARCLKRKVEFRFGAAVTRVMVKDGRAAGVELADGSVEDAEFVVAGVAPGVLDALVPGPSVRGAVPARAEAAVPSRLTVHLALRGPRPEGTPHRTVVHGTDRATETAWLFDGAARPDRPTVTVLRPGDAAQVPDDAHEAVTLTVTVPSGAAVSDADVDAVLAAAGRAVPELRERLLWHEIRTPRDIAEATGAEGGAVPAPALAAARGALLHPANSTPLPGLLAVGGWSHPGGGLPHAGMSGALVAGLVVEGPEFRGSQ